MSIKQYSSKQLIISNWIEHIPHPSLEKIDLLSPLRNWLNNIKVSDRKLAHKLCHVIPTQCPFARKVTIFGHTIFSIPPLCKLNPLYDEVIALRFRAICYLADECGEDVSAYC